MSTCERCFEKAIRLFQRSPDSALRLGFTRSAFAAHVEVARVKLAPAANSGLGLIRPRATALPHRLLLPRSRFLLNTPDNQIDPDQKLLARLYSLVAETLSVPLDEITPQSGPLTLPQWDSFHHVHLMVAIEEQYGIELGVEEISTMITVEEIARVLHRKGVLSA